MESILSGFSWDWVELAKDFLRISLAFIISIPLAWERHKSRTHIGLRTFPIVAIASCGFMLIFKREAGLDVDTAFARLLQGLLTGIGFIGGGAIIKTGGNVEGLATAASIWCTGAIGASVAFDRLEIAVVLSVITFLTLRFLAPFKEDEG